MSLLDGHLALFRCPRCGGGLARTGGPLHCSGCRQEYPVPEDGMPRLFWPNEWEGDRLDVTDRIKAFYEATPFPDYDGFDDVSSLIEKARRGFFAKLLDDQVPVGALILECGCGTGQLTNFLSVANRTVLGTDICLNSLTLANDFRRRHGLDGAFFCQMNLFRPCLRPASFDLVISNGVLHHTADPFLAYRTIAGLVKPGGHLIVGLYHKYGRIYTDLRRRLFHLTGDRFKFLDRHNVNPRLSQAKRRAWFMDQYKNPHESKHTIGQVLGWVEALGFSFVKSIPKTVPFQPFLENENLFADEEPGSAIERFLVEAGQALTGADEGGFFIVIARRPGP
ncbi:MAG: class I SAM-dependent methyltransferase [Magnetococcales bacterium]|nr:class I SAM-dependent methyltransferase [Magnetococcales bacterium]